MSGKIKAINPEIIVCGDVQKPYYQIKYYDTADKRYHIGYGSYCYGNVIEWLKEYFEPIQADEQPVVHGHWVYNRNGMDWNLGAWECSACKCRNNNLPGSEIYSPYSFVGSRYCPNCGAKMDKEN